MFRDSPSIKQRTSQYYFFFLSPTNVSLASRVSCSMTYNGWRHSSTAERPICRCQSPLLMTDGIRHPRPCLQKYVRASQPSAVCLLLTSRQRVHSMSTHRLLCNDHFCGGTDQVSRQDLYGIAASALLLGITRITSNGIYHGCM